MKNIKGFDDLFFDERDFTSSLKNFIAHGIIPGTESERQYFGKLIDYLFKIKEYVQFNWAECDILFIRNRVIINCQDSETKKDVEIIIDYKDNWISWCGHKLWVPKGKLEWLNNWIYEIRQKQLTIPGIHIPKS